MPFRWFCHEAAQIGPSCSRSCSPSFDSADVYKCAILILLVEQTGANGYASGFGSKASSSKASFVVALSESLIHSSVYIVSISCNKGSTELILIINEDKLL